VDGADVATLGPGALFGELALLYDAARAASVVAMSDAVVWRVGRREFKFAVRLAAKKSRATISETLSKVEILTNLGTEQIAAITSALERLPFAAGEQIIHQGDAGDIFYIIESGSVTCTDQNGRSADISLPAGSYFGELALLTAKPRQRSVIANEDTVCLALDRASFQRHLGDLESIMGVNMRHRVLQCMPLFSKLSNLEKLRLAEAFETETFPAGAEIVMEGQPGDKFFVIHSGVAYTAKGGQRIPNANIKEGSFFGEMALLNEAGKRAATVVAESKDGVACFTLTRAKFAAVLGPTALASLVKATSAERQSQLDQATTKFEDLDRHGFLGAGTFGIVYLVTRKNSSDSAKDAKPMALKCMKKAQVAANSMANSIDSERRLMSSVEHPFLLRLIATFQDRDQVYMLLDFVVGGELFSRLANSPGGKLPWAHSRFYAACVVSAFTHLHAKEIIYRDLKPENLLIDRYGYLRVVDFGFAKKVPRSSSTFTICGTPEYLAPEIITRKGHNWGVDNYAVGILVYEMEVSVSPFMDPSGDQNPMTIQKNILRGDLRFPKGINERTRKLVTSLLVKQPGRRLGGGKSGTAEVAEHDYFKELDFQMLLRKRYKAPWKPQRADPLDRSNFDEYEVDMRVPNYSSWLKKQGSAERKKLEGAFDGF
jgi:cGMP-dependent protein kinase